VDDTFDAGFDNDAEPYPVVAHDLVGFCDEMYRKCFGIPCPGIENGRFVESPMKIAACRATRFDSQPVVDPEALGPPGVQVLQMAEEIAARKAEQTEVPVGVPSDEDFINSICD